MSLCTEPKHQNTINQLRHDFKRQRTKSLDIAMLQECCFHAHTASSVQGCLVWQNQLQKSQLNKSTDMRTEQRDDGVRRRRVTKASPETKRETGITTGKKNANERPRLEAGNHEVIRQMMSRVSRLGSFTFQVWILTSVLLSQIRL